MTDADKAMNPQYFAIDPAEIQIRIRINPKIGIRIPDHFRLIFRPWWSFALWMFLLNSFKVVRKTLQ